MMTVTPKSNQTKVATPRRIPLDAPDLTGNEETYVREAVRSGWLSWAGPFVGEFEKRFADYIGCRYALSTANGTGALYLALQVLHIGRGDEVILPTLTFSATAGVVSLVGAKAVFADSVPGKFGMDPGDVERKVTPRTKAIIVVHLYGWPVDMAAIMKIAQTHRLSVIEDAAQAIGTQDHGRRVGGLGTIGCFSFHNKQMSTGEGGMITTNDEALAQEVESLKNPSPDNRGTISHLSLNMRMSNLHAAVGLAQLERIDALIDKRRTHAALYNRLLKDQKKITLFEEGGEEYCTYWRYNVKVDGSQETFVRRLNQEGIQCRPIYLPLHLHPNWENENHPPCPHAEAMARTAVDLPSSPILSEEEIVYVVEAIRKALS